MNKIISFIVALLACSATCFSQTYPVSQTIGAPTTLVVSRGGFKADSALVIPSFIDTFKANVSPYIKSYAGNIIRIGDSLYMRSASARKWITINSAGGGGSVDTTSLSNRINARVKYTDTAAMLAPYLRKVDTLSLSNRINARIDSLRRSNDSIYARKNGVFVFQYKDSTGGSTIDTTSLSNRIDARVKYTDTSAMLSPYLRKADTANAFVNSVTKLNDSTIQVIKGTSTTNITLTTSSIVTAATRLVTTAYNNTGVTISKGSVVYISGRHSSNLPTIALSQANNEFNSYRTFALVENDITDNNSGTIIQAGSITGLNLPTSSFTDGDIVYLSPTVAGGLTITKPLAPNHICKIGSVTRAHPTQGSIEIKIENGWQLDELSDVSIPAVPADSVILQFSRVDSLWHDVTISNAIGTRYIRPSDTSVFQRKQLPAYSFQANGTNAAANGVATYFKDTSGTYTGSPVWNSSNPTGATNHTYRWTRIGKMVNLSVTLIYATGGGTGNTQVLIPLPTDCPAPIEPSGLGAATDVLYTGAGHLSTGITSLSLAGRFGLRSNGTDTGYELIGSFGSGSSLRTCFINVVYYTNN